MTRFVLLIEYDGRPFMGWQRQSHGPSVQQCLEEAVLKVTSEQIHVQGSGRTDSGVHASGQVAHLDIDYEITEFRLKEAINAHMRTNPVAVLDCRRAKEDFHARFSAIGRHYVYHIINRRAPLTVQKGLAWQVVPDLDVESMQRAAQALIGRHDFTSFRSVHCQAKSAVRTLDRLVIRQQGADIKIAASARSFLHHQVRSMVGCLVLVGLGRWPEDRIRETLDARNRAALGLCAPPDGLTLACVDYPQDPFLSQGERHDPQAVNRSFEQVRP